MPLDVIVGAQWGDEGKGRVVDLLAARADYVARYNGGATTQHTSDAVAAIVEILEQEGVFASQPRALHVLQPVGDDPQVVLQAALDRIIERQLYWD